MRATYKVSDRLTLDGDLPDDVVRGAAIGTVVLIVFGLLLALGWAQSVVDTEPEHPHVVTNHTLPPTVARQLDQLPRTTVPGIPPQAARQQPQPVPSTTAPAVGSGRG